MQWQLFYVTKIDETFMNWKYKNHKYCEQCAARKQDTGKRIPHSSGFYTLRKICLSIKTDEAIASCIQISVARGKSKLYYK